jgi:2-polyprenyl-3-methyl-5-hydroxy-6-metoxy-1,4-benzoquinol methylase
VCGGGRARPVWHEDGERYVRCRGCGVAFADVTALHYERRRHNVWDEEILSDAAEHFYRDARRTVHDQFLAEVSRRRVPGKLLDIGCGLGVFMAAAAAAGWDVYGCDTSASWVARARSRVGVDRVVHAGAHAGMFGGRRFDLITLWDVLEHVYDPISTLTAVRHLLAPGGELFIRTPNFRYVWPIYGLRRALGDEVELGPLNHVVLFDRASLEQACRHAGLRVTSWPVLRPPQVTIRGAALSVTAKNAWAATAGRVAQLTQGRVVLGSDLDAWAIVD